MNESRNPILEFKKEIGFDHIIETGGANSGVIVDWFKPATWDFFVDKNWKLEDTDFYHWRSGAEGNWIFEKGHETIELEIFVSSLGIEPARQKLIDIASATTMLEIPYKKSARPIGTLSVNTPGDQGGIYIWVFRNICFRLDGRETNENIEVFARGIQTIAEKGEVKDLASHFPQIESVEVYPPAAKVDSTFSVRTILDAGIDFDINRYSFEFRYDEENLALEYDEGNAATFTALRAGTAKITVHVVDRNTLLSNWQTAIIKVEK